jgi:threonine/homoserine/homoserine lactone efflux protein
MFFAANGARFGFIATIPANIGYHIATWLITFIIGFGFLSFINEFKTLFLTVKYIGVVYIFWIAWKFIRAGILEIEEVKPPSFFNGAVLLLCNPKGYVIITTMFSQFVQPDQPNIFLFVIMITSIFTLNNAIAFISWTLMGDWLAHYFRHEKYARRLNIGFGVMLGLVAFWMVLQ